MKRHLCAALLCCVGAGWAVAAVAEAPTLTGGRFFSYDENQAATAIDSTLAVADIDSPTLASASVWIGTNFAAQDVLGFSDGPGMGNVAGNYNANSGVLTLTSAGATATLVQWQTALRSVTYVNVSDAPDTGPRTVLFVVSDGATSSNAISSTIALTASNDAPTVSGSSGVGYDDFQQSATAINTRLVVADPDSVTLASGTVSITANFAAGQDVLGFVPGAGTGNVTGNYNAGMGVLTLFSAGSVATLAQWQTALRSVTYVNTSFVPNAGTRVVAFVLSDGIASSNALSSTITVSPGVAQPTLNGSSLLDYAENDAASSINTALTIADLDSTTLVSATISISENFHGAEDLLGFSNGPGMGDIQGAYNTNIGLLQLFSPSSTASLAQWQTALRTVTYVNTSNAPSTVPRTVAFVVNDGTVPSNTLYSTITLSLNNDAPTLGGGSVLAYTENQSAAAIDPGLAVADVDSTTLASASIWISANFAGAQDVLGFINGPGMDSIAGSYNAGTGELTLTSADAHATVAQWRNALRAVTYRNSSDSPSTATRTFTFRVNDGSADSNPVQSTTTPVAVNDAPMVEAPASLNLFEDGLAQLGVVDVADADAGASPLSMSMTVSSGTLLATSAAGVIVTGAPGPSIGLSGSASALDAWFAGGTAVQYVPVENENGSATLSIQTSDNGAAPGPAGTDSDAVSIQIASVPDTDAVASIEDGVAFVSIGESIAYVATLSNAGPEAIQAGHNVRAQFVAPAGLIDLHWTCSGSVGASCGASGDGAINDLVTLPVGGEVAYLIEGTVSASATHPLDVVFAYAASPALQGDNLSNNADTDSNGIRDVFRNGFE